ncbi:MAG TPA: hypothetical protein VKV04_18915 [Verrucomicrobiae bacterium]|jgi:hypothetical protein|nr:hypothetical protein [Verrucomicrobiae bacterium]
MKSAPLDQVQLIERSLRCFACGIIGILPGIGLPFAIVALGECLRVSLRKGAQLNPAERYLHWGALGATAGLLLTIVLAAALAIKLSWIR